MIHLTPPEMQLARFPAIHAIRFSDPTSPEHYSLPSMILWSSLPYAVWQLSYHFLITVRRRAAIAAGRPTSFTWLRKSYSKNFLGKLVLSLPDPLQEPAFMGIQYSYALLTMLPCPIWFWYRWPSAMFLFVVFVWSVSNGATFYIDVFGKRFQKELQQLQNDVAKWQTSPEAAGGAITPGEMESMLSPGEKSASMDHIPLLDQERRRSAPVTDEGIADVALRKAQ